MDAGSSASSDLERMIDDQMIATIRGQSVGDAIGLLTEFMTKQEALEHYGKNGKKPKTLLYSQMVADLHRRRWEKGDWTDDTDHVVIIMQSVLYNKGQVLKLDFGPRVLRWDRRGFPELGDIGGMGIGATTSKVLHQPEFKTKPHESACHVWEASRRKVAPNGAVMRTSILGLHQWQDMDAVVKNTLEICKCTHYDPRCQASSLAVSVAIALMLQHTSQEVAAGRAKQPRSVSESSIIKKAYDVACQVLTTKEEKEDLWWYMSCTKLKLLQLDEEDKIGYTYKCMGAAFWAFKQKDFQKAIIKILMAGGDADTNCAVAGAMLACKLGISAIPQSWLEEQVHTDWLMGYVNKFLKLQREMSLPLEERSSHEDLELAVLLAADKDRALEEEKERQKRFEEFMKTRNEEADNERRLEEIPVCCEKNAKCRVMHQ